MARFVKGEPRPPNAGRKKGSKNKKTVIKVEDYLAENGINPTQKLMELLPLMDAATQGKVLLELIKYFDSQRKESTSSTNPVETQPESTASVADLLSIVKNKV